MNLSNNSLRICTHISREILQVVKEILLKIVLGIYQGILPSVYQGSHTGIPRISSRNTP